MTERPDSLSGQPHDHAADGQRVAEGQITLANPLGPPCTCTDEAPDMRPSNYRTPEESTMPVTDEDLAQDPMWGMDPSLHPKTPEEHAQTCCSPRQKEGRQYLEERAQAALEEGRAHPLEDRQIQPVQPFGAPQAKGANEIWSEDSDEPVISLGTGSAKPSLLTEIRHLVKDFLEFRAQRQARR